MRNKYAGPCYRCGEMVAPGEGHFERYQGGWRTQHAACAILWRGKPPSAAREAAMVVTTQKKET